MHVISSWFTCKCMRNMILFEVIKQITYIIEKLYIYWNKPNAILIYKKCFKCCLWMLRTFELLFEMVFGYSQFE